MPSPREIKRRIGSIRNTQKITKAMEMVASVKMRKARLQIINARPYAKKLSEIAANLHNSFTHSMSPLLVSREVNKIGLVLISSDKGLCGGFNANVVKKAIEFIRENSDKEIVLTLVGKRVTEAFKRRNFFVTDKYIDVFFKPNYRHATSIGQKLLTDFLSRTIDEVVIVYNEFKSTVSQKVQLEKLLPVPPIKSEKKQGARADYIFEPDGRECLDSLLPRYFTYQLWRCILESFAAEQGARMAAMNGATKNAGELIDKLSLFYNKARQSSITKELLEVVSGAESLR